MNAKITACLGLACLSISARGQNWLEAPIVYENMPGEIRLAGDVDQDGDVDYIRFNGSPSFWTSFVVLSNLSDGQFVTGTPVALPTQSAHSVLLEDVNGDGRRDVIVSTLTGSSAGIGLSVFPGMAGGTFAAPIHVSLPGWVLRIRSGDVNADGIRDLAVVNDEPPTSAWAVRWILGSASNAFTVMPPHVFGPSEFIKDIAALDGNADGVDDVAVAHDGFVSFFFTAAGSPTVAGPTFPIVSDSLAFFVTGDIDGDTDADLLVFTTMGFTTNLLTRFRNLGGGSWSALPGVPYPNTHGGAAFLGDWDGDGSPDLFVRELGGTNGSYELLKNDGTGSFASVFASATGLPSDTGGAGLFDINADGRLDFIDSAALYYGDGTFNGFGSGPGISAHPLRDWEGDGDLDIPWENGQIRKNDGRGVFTSTFITRPPAPGGQFYGGGESIVEDFDGDGLNEFLVQRFFQFPIPGCIPSPANPGACQFIDMRRFEDTGTGSAVDLGPCAAPGVNIGSVFSSDVDGDGDLDLVGSQGVFLNDGSQFFSPPSSPPYPYLPMARGDVDGDGDQDYLATYFGGSQSVAILRSGPAAPLNVEVLYPPTTGTVLVNRPTLADLDDDGDLDIAVDKGPTGTAITIYANSGGTFAQSTVIPVPTSLGQTLLSAGDVDGDGLTDLLLSAGNRTRVYRRTGPGFTYGAPRIYRTPAGVRQLADFDGDGDEDLIGTAIVRNNRFDGPTAGLRRQYGVGLAGTAGLIPVIGTTGPLRVGSSVTVRVRQAVGGASGILGIGAVEASTPNYGGIPGLTHYIDQVADILTIAVGGAAGAPGAGSLDLPVLIPPSFAGLHVFVQAGFGDAGAQYGISTTNGLEILVGP